MRRAQVFSGLLALSSIACGPGFERVAPESVPAFEVAKPESVGMDSQRLEDSVRELPPGHGLHALLVFRRGRLVFERYFGGYEADMLHDLRSATKSLTALAVGSLLDDGTLPALNAPITQWLREEYPKTAKHYDEIRVEDLLTMRTGLDCDDSDSSTRGQEDRMYESEDWVGYFLDLDRLDSPGKQARYCTGGVVALGRILELADGQNFKELSWERLLTPLNIENARYERFDEERGVDSGGHIHLRARDLLKFGELLLGGGMFRERRIISEEYVKQATSKHTKLGSESSNYGYLFWLDEVTVGVRGVDVVYASGNGGQALFVVPEHELAVVTLAGNYNSPKASLSFHWFAQGVLPAIDP